MSGRDSSSRYPATSNPKSSVEECELCCRQCIAIKILRKNSIDYSVEGGLQKQAGGREIHPERLVAIVTVQVRDH